MVARISILLEIMAVIVCVHCLYKRKVKFDISTIALYLSCVILFELENIYGIGFYCTVMAYLLTMIYCIKRYGDSILGAGFSLFLVIILMSIMQFFFIMIIAIFVNVDGATRGLYTNILVLGNCILVLPRSNIYGLRAYVKKRNSFLVLLAIFPLFVVSCIQFQERRFGRIHLLLFVFAVPMLAFFLLLMGKWLKEQEDKCTLEKELQVTKSMQEKYDDLFKIVRMRQHEFKNHLAAILAAHYTYKSYDKLVKAQKEYCDELMEENKYNDLLLLGNSVLIGFLHEKFREIEENGVEVRFTIRGILNECSIPVHHLVEMTGILLDNAFQAVENNDSGRIVQFDFLEDKEVCFLKISNPYVHVSCDEIEAWFRMGKSTKGKGRGVGLYRVRSLCQEEGCNISVRNAETDGINWIEFVLIVEKADEL